MNNKLNIVKFQVLFWDFDGVLLNSNMVRDEGFLNVLDSYPECSVDELLLYHRENGGLSRYVKFRHFFEEILKVDVSEEEIKNLSARFSELMITKLVNKDLLIKENIDLVTYFQGSKRIHIVSGSDEVELNYLCKELGIAMFFNSIHGSPTAKNELVRHLIEINSYKQSECVLIGDSKNDLEAAMVNNISFIPYNNNELNYFSPH